MSQLVWVDDGLKLGTQKQPLNVQLLQDFRIQLARLFPGSPLLAEKHPPVTYTLLFHNNLKILLQAALLRPHEMILTVDVEKGGAHRFVEQMSSFLGRAQCVRKHGDNQVIWTRGCEFSIDISNVESWRDVGFRSIPASWTLTDESTQLDHIRACIEGLDSSAGPHVLVGVLGTNGANVSAIVEKIFKSTGPGKSTEENKSILGSLVPRAFEVLSKVRSVSVAVLLDEIYPETVRDAKSTFQMAESWEGWSCQSHGQDVQETHFRLAIKKVNPGDQSALRGSVFARQDSRFDSQEVSNGVAQLGGIVRAYLGPKHLPDEGYDLHIPMPGQRNKWIAWIQSRFLQIWRNAQDVGVDESLYVKA